MKTKSKNLLPKILPGTVHAQMIRCGKTNCKCARGELHGAYFYHFVRDGGRLKKRYLKPDEVQNVKNACEAYMQTRKEHRELIRSSFGYWRKLSLSLQDCEKTPNNHSIK